MNFLFLQNQQGPTPKRWDRSGTVVASLAHGQCQVKVDGSGRVTLRDRRFLRAYTPVTPSILPSPRTETPQFTSPHTERINLEEVFRPLAVAFQPAAPDAPPSPAQDTVTNGGPIGITPPGLPTSIVLVTQVLAPQPSPPKVTRIRSSRARQPPKRHEPETCLWLDP